MKRWMVVLILGFAVYAAGILMYFGWADIYSLPPEMLGTNVDPETFMSPDQIQRAEALSRVRSIVYFIETPLQLILMVLLVGISIRFRKTVERLTRRRVLQLGLFVLLFLSLVYALMLPFDYLMLLVERHYGVSNVATGTWLTDRAKNLGIEWVTSSLLFLGLLAIMRRSPRRWWVWVWMLSIPLLLFVQFIQPVIIEPLYNEFIPLREGPLKKELLRLAAESGISSENIYEVNMSERTNQLNAYVSGIGSNARVVLWDTTLEKLEPREILVVMAHEMGHYAERHIFWGSGFGLLLSFGLVWAGSRFYEVLIRNWGTSRGLSGPGDLAALPLLLAVVSLFTLLVTPLNNTASRLMEVRADRYAMRLTGDGAAAASAFQKLAATNLSPVTQPRLLQLFLGTHPTIEKRIRYFNQYKDTSAP
ncbi:M48 family metallopeptidase [Paenibacillus lutrae]|uniref:M48 family metalloprotease n=1 Tax=Paenibacillus lutrae TaxID=2078573 RepID=A0A7X3FHR3_9BACL|nr:M48 family metallopeptidase [Paenibacillus lutrae]MVO99877.1 M48 family metalloprotease [Paenibacillus lutrae]